MYSSDLIEEILMSESAQRMIQRVTHKYGDSYTMLWLFEVIGETNDDLLGMVDDFKHQLVPQTATWSLPIWEESLGLPVDVTLSIDVRRMAIIEKKRKRVPMNPARMEEIVSAIAGGADTWLDEYSGKNRFTMHIYDVPEIDVRNQITQKIKKIKQSHRIVDVIYEKPLSSDLTLYIGYITPIIMTATVPYHEYSTYGDIADLTYEQLRGKKYIDLL